MKVSIKYTSDVIWPGLDDRIRTAIESIGGKWYAQGRDAETGERDIAFDFDMADQAKIGTPTQENAVEAIEEAVSNVTED